MKRLHAVFIALTASTLVSCSTTPHRETAALPKPVAAPVVEEVPVADDSELIAVISAAVAMMMEDGSAFTVRRVRRVQNAPAWQKAGREEQVYSRF